MVIKKTEHTLEEIKQQTWLWEEIYKLVLSQKKNLKKFLGKCTSNPLTEVIFTGAGSSFFVGEMIAGVWQQNTGIPAKAVGTTEIISHPQLYLYPQKPLLLVSFARSGNSPESMATLKLSEKVCREVYHLIITCNKNGQLAEMEGNENVFKLILPEETNDIGLAMTSSVSSMYLAALLISRLDEIEILKTEVSLASQYIDKFFADFSSSVKNTALLNFKRAVFLGSGMFLGMAHEAHLKLQELTNGKIICKFDSFLGFRHGPKVVVNKETLLVYFFSNNNYVNLYERDLVASSHSGNKPLYIIGVSEKQITGLNLNLNIIFSEDEKEINEAFLVLPYLVIAQLLAYFKSLACGLNPDFPSENGAIHRVVQGVKIYPFENITEKAKLLDAKKILK